MASTYTGNNGIEKPATGDQSGTWGTTTNLNFDIIDRVLSGIGTITLSGTTHTLTTTDGTLSDCMFKALVLSGSPSGTNTITISPNDQQKLYLMCKRYQVFLDLHTVHYLIEQKIHDYHAPMLTHKQLLYLLMIQDLVEMIQIFLKEIS